MERQNPANAPKNAIAIPCGMGESRRMEEMGATEGGSDERDQRCHGA